MSYIGRGLEVGSMRQLDDISSSFDGSTTGFTMQINSVNVDQSVVGDVNQLVLSLGGVIQEPGTDFTVSGSTLTFTTAPAANTNFFCIIYGGGGGFATPGDLTVTTSKLATTVLTGATDIGAAIVDADLFLIDDGAGGTLRKVTASRIKTYAGTDLDAAVTINDSGAAVDFRVEGDTKQNLLFVDGSADKVGINTNAPDMLFDITGSVTAGAGSDEKLQQWNIGSDNVKAEVEYVDASADRGFAIGTSSQHDFLFRTNDTKRGKIDYNGDFIYGSGTTNDGLFTINHNAAGEYTFSLNNSVASGNIYAMKGTFTAQAPDNNTSFFYWGNDNSTGRFGVYSDGDVVNHDNSYGSMSDERIKQNIRDANSQWDDIKAVKVRNFKKKDDVRQYADKAWEQIGVIAQELETAGMDKLIKHANPTEADIKSSSEFGTLYEDGDSIPEGKKIGDIKEVKAQVKKVSYSVLYMKAIKALQEAMAKIEALETSNTDLKNRVTALEG